MNQTVAKIVNGSMKALIPAAVYLLGIVCPVIPGFIWMALFNAIIGGDVTVEHLQQFLTDHNIKTYSEPTDFPVEKSSFTPSGG